MSKKNIVLLTNVNPYKASGRLITDLKNILKGEGHNVIIITNTYILNVSKDVINFKSIFTFLSNKFFIKIKSIFYPPNRPLDPNYYMFDFESHKRQLNVSKILKKLVFEPDAFIYVFPHNFLNEEVLFELNKSTGAPIFRYMADMAELTGGCHYAWDCEGYMNNCGNCPGLYSDNPIDETYENLKFKKRYIDKTEVYPIAASEWQYQQLLKSTLYKSKKSFKILSPTNEILFQNRNKMEVRQELKLPIEKKIILFGAVNNFEKRKGGNKLIEALVLLSEMVNPNEKMDIHLLIVGNNPDSKIEDLGFSISSFGYIDYETLAKTYQASDIFLCPSIEDSGPTMINQSMMSGTPVVSFLMGVASDLVINGKTGYTAELNNAMDLAVGLKSMIDLSVEDQKLYSNNCRKLAFNTCSYKRIAEQFNDLITKDISASDFTITNNSINF